MNSSETLPLSWMGLSSPPPPLLYHYTSAQALLSIVTSGHIWATHIRFLNDTSEAEWMWATAHERLRVREENAVSGDEKASVAKLIDMVNERRSSTDFVASFSENGDDLSQWRAYCHDTPGFSIGFSSDALATQWICNPGGDSFFVGASLKKVIYLGSDDAASFDKTLDFILNTITPAMHDNAFIGDKSSREQVSVSWLSVIASTYKHSSFRNENEWRLIMAKPHKPMPGQRFRVGKSSLIPYVEVELNRNHKFEKMTEKMIERIVVGPSPDPNLSVHAVKSFLSSIGQYEVEVIPSSIPYKNW